MPTENNSFKDQLTLYVGKNLRICHFNVEEMSKAIFEVPTKIMNIEKVDVIALQEIHTNDDNDIQKRGYIAAYIIIGAIYHKKYGIATYIKKNIENTNVIHRKYSENIQKLVTKVRNVTVTNVYKPPNEKCKTNPMNIYEHPAINIGRFNSHNITWGFEKNDENGDLLYEWLTTVNLELVYSIKNIGTYRSARRL